MKNGFVVLHRSQTAPSDSPLHAVDHVQSSAWQYLGLFVHVVDLPSWQALWSANTSHMVVLTFKYSIVGGRTSSDFYIADMDRVAQRHCNDAITTNLPASTYLFHKSYPGILI